MLSKQRLITSFRNGKARPHFLKLNPKHIELATTLINVFQDCRGKRRFEIEERIKNFNIEKINPKVVQGLADLLYKRSSFDDLGGLDSVKKRQQIFSSSAAYWRSAAEDETDFLQHRKNILKNTQFEPAIETIDEHQLFGDITTNQRLLDFNIIQPAHLIHRFNIAQVQGLLLNIRSLELRIYRRQNAAFKQVMQMMKFFKLMFELKEVENDWITLAIDGPAAVLDNSRSYGIEIALFFPAILLLDIPWQLNASLKIPNRKRIFSMEITEDNLYQSHYQARNIWTHEKTTLLLERFNQKYPGRYHGVSDPEIIPLRDNRYLLPDFSIIEVETTGEDKTKRQMRIEWIHYLSDKKLKWIKQVKSQLPENYVFAIKGKREKLKSLIKTMEKHLLVYTNTLTAPAIVKKFEDT
jgi:predicted nuclease of restriction endonuclease-like RecB superfamily